MRVICGLTRGASTTYRGSPMAKTTLSGVGMKVGNDLEIGGRRDTGWLPAVTANNSFKPTPLCGVT